MKKELVARLLWKSRFQPPTTLRRVLDTPITNNDPARRALRRTRWNNNTSITTTTPRFIKGVVNGQYMRIRIPPEAPPPRTVPKLHNPANPPLKPFTQPSQSATASSSSSSSTTALAISSSSSTTTTAVLQGIRGATSSDDFWNRLHAWLKHNFAVLVLNLGSVLSLVGFTRSDVSSKQW